MRYHYKIEYLRAASADNLDTASAASGWSVYCDRSASAPDPSPVTDQQPATARSLRLTLTGADGLPDNADPYDLANSRNGSSVVEFKVFPAK